MDMRTAPENITEKGLGTDWVEVYVEGIKDTAKKVLRASALTCYKDGEKCDVQVTLDKLAKEKRAMKLSANG